MRTTKKQVQKLISECFPFNMTYQKGQAVKVGKGKLSKRIPRTVGASQDRLFSVIIYGGAVDVRKVEFMNPFHNKRILARNMVVVRSLIESLCPDWNEEDNHWFTATVGEIPDNKKTKRKQVELTRLDLYGQGILFVTLQ